SSRNCSLMRFKFAARSASSFNVARAALDKPDGVVREVIFPVAGEQTFEKLVKEAAAGAGQRHARIHTVVRASYGSYYRRMLPKLLAAIEFRSNNATHRSLLDAIEVIRAAVDGGRQYYELDEIAVEDVIRPSGATSSSRTRPMGPGASTASTTRSACSSRCA